MSEQAYAEAVAARAAQVREQRAALVAAIDETRVARSLTFSDDEHDPDGSLASLDQARDVALLRQAEDTLHQLEAARERLTEGTWKTCDRCGEEIGLPRLLARPETRRCVTCAAPTTRRRH